MIAAWMLRMVVASVLIGAGAWLFERALAARGLPRRGAWVAGLVAVMAAPFLALLVPSVPDAAALLGGEVIRIAGDTSPATMVSRGAERGGSLIAGAVWLTATLLGLAIYAAGWWRLRIARRAWRRDRVAGASVLVSAGAGPAAVGVLQPAIVVPEWLLSEHESVQRLVVLHESEHLAAGDHRVLALAPLVLVLMPWNVAAWWMVRRLRLGIELDCDRRVLARGVEASVYGSLLLDVAGRRGVGALAIALASPRSGLERRIEALTCTLPGTARGRVAATVMMAFACVVVACAVAPTAPLDRVADDEVRAQVGLAADLLTRFSDPATLWTIDGVPATRDDVLGLPPGGIAMVRAQENMTRQIGVEAPASLLPKSAIVVNVLTPEWVAANPDAVQEIEAEALPGIDAMREMIEERGVHVMIDGRAADAADVRALADGDIAKVEVVRRKAGDDVASAIHIETKPGRSD